VVGWLDDVTGKTATGLYVVVSKKWDGQSHSTVPQAIITGIDDYRMEAALEPAEKGV